MNVYPAAVDAFLRGEIDVRTAPLRAQLVGEDYAYEPTHTAQADLTDTIGSPVAVTGASVSTGTGTVMLDPDQPITFNGLAAGQVVTAAVFYVEGGPLLCHVDRRADTVPLTVTLNGAPLALSFTRLFKL